MTEIWKDVKGYEERYQVSNLGRIRSVRIMGYFLKGYCYVVLSKNRKTQYTAIHRLVAQTFIPNPLNKPFVNHINGNPKDNRPENLEWCTQKENVEHSWRTGLATNDRQYCRGTAHASVVLTEKQVRVIKHALTLGVPYHILATMTNAALATIGKIARGITWKHINI